MPAMFDRLCLAFGPVKDGGNIRVSRILGRSTKSVKMWRSGMAVPPRWAYDLIRLTLDERRRVYEQTTGLYRMHKMGFGFGAVKLSAAVGLHYGAAANDSVFQVPTDLRDKK